ncbi:MAG TPA: hypothetical protein VGD34_27510 [Kribbella sp.]
MTDLLDIFRSIDSTGGIPAMGRIVVSGRVAARLLGNLTDPPRPPLAGRQAACRSAPHQSGGHRMNAILSTYKGKAGHYACSTLP